MTGFGREKQNHWGDGVDQLLGPRVIIIDTLHKASLVVDVALEALLRWLNQRLFISDRKSVV